MAPESAQVFPLSIAVEAIEAAGHSAPMPAPSPPGSASAPKEGEGGKAAPAKKPARRVDWGKVNRLMRNFALIYGTDTVWDGEEFRIVKISALRLAFGTDPVKYWLSMEDRRMILPEQLVFEPQESQGDDGRKINMYRGLELQPVECDPEECAPMLDLLRHLCAISAETPDEVEAVVEWVLRWQALPLQQPGAKMASAIVLHGPQGTGKNIYWDAWRDLYGLYGITVGQNELEDKFNDWLSCKLAIVGDEVVSRQEMYHNKNTLKRVVTQEKKFPIRAIQQAVRWESNHANVVFLSNESQPLALENGDRRYLVIYTPTEAEGDLYSRVIEFLENGGLGKWLHFLLTYPLDGFTRHTKPMLTRAKADLIQLGLLPAQRFAAEWLEGFLPLPVRVCSTEQLFKAFQRWADHAGEKFVPPRDRFTRDVERMAIERVERDDKGKRLEPRLRTTVATYRLPDGGRRSVRCWLPRDAEPPQGVTVGEWARDSIAAFETDLRAFTRSTSPVAEVAE